MSKPFIHAESSARKFGGEPADYLPIHQKMDSSKSVIADNRHRVIFHSSFGIFIIEQLFGQDYKKLWELKTKHGLTDEAIYDIIKYVDYARSNECNTIKNSDGKDVSVREIAEQHCLEDFGQRFIPSLNDYLDYMDYADWMNGKGFPNSFKKLDKYTREKHGLKPNPEFKDKD